MSRYHAFLSMQGRGVLTLPADLRRRMGLDRPGAQLEVTEREDGTLELRPTVAVPADQAWFWTERWQAMEREVDEHFAGGHVTQFESENDFLASLEDSPPKKSSPKSK